MLSLRTACHLHDLLPYCNIGRFALQAQKRLASAGALEYNILHGKNLGARRRQKRESSMSKKRKTRAEEKAEREALSPAERFRREVYDWIESLMVALIFCVILFSFIHEPHAL